MFHHLLESQHFVHPHVKQIYIYVGNLKLYVSGLLWLSLSPFSEGTRTSVTNSPAGKGLLSGCHRRGTHWIGPISKESKETETKEISILHGITLWDTYQVNWNCVLVIHFSLPMWFFGFNSFFFYWLTVITSPPPPPPFHGHPNSRAVA